MAKIEIYHERGTFVFNTVEELLNLEDVKWHSDRPDFYEFGIGEPDHLGRIALLSLNNRNEEYIGCSMWWVVGEISDISPKELGLPLWKDRTTKHKPDCWHYKYLSIKPMMDWWSKPVEFNMKILKDAGWHKDDYEGCAVYCDCGYTQYTTKTLNKTYKSDE